MKKIVIFDIDGTLADDTHRSKGVDFDKLKGTDWYKYYDKHQFDTPIKQTIDLLNMYLFTGRDVWIVTGRSSHIRSSTLDWLCENVELYGRFNEDHLIMNDCMDGCSNAEYKRRFGVTIGFDNIDCVFEDSESCVKMWRDNGVQCYQTQYAPW